MSTDFEKITNAITSPVIQDWFRERRGKSASGFVDCPLCGKEKGLHLMSSVNARGGGGRCSTPKCLEWRS